MAFANLVVRISGDISSLDAATKKSVAKLTAFGNQLSSLGTSAALGITAPIVAFGAVALKRAGDLLEALKLGLLAVTRNAKVAETQFNQLREVAKLPGLGLKEAVQGSINLQALGFSADKAKNILLQFGNAIATTGRGREDLAEVIRQLGQLGARSQVTADNLKPIIERVPQVASIIREKFGASALGNPAETFKKLGISSQELIAILEEELGKAPRVASGFRNSMENVRESAELAFAEAGKALIPFANAFLKDFAEPAIERAAGLARSFQDMSKPVQTLIVGLGGIAAVGPLVVAAIGNILSNLALITEAFGKAGGAAKLFGQALRGLNAAALAYGIVELTDALLKNRDAEIGLVQSGRDLETSINKTIAALKKQGVAVDESTRFKEQAARVVNFGGKPTEILPAQKGTESTKEFIKYLNDLAIAQGKTVIPTKTAADGINKFGDNAKDAAKKAKEAEKDFNELTKALQSQATARAVLASVTSGGFQVDPVEVYRAKVELAKAEVQRVTQAVAEFELKGGTAFDIPQIDTATEGVLKLANGFEFLQGKFDSAIATIRDGSIDLSKFKFPTPAEQNRVYFPEIGKENQKEYEDGLKNAARQAKQYSNEVSLITNDLSRDIAKLVFQGGKVKDVLVGSFKSIGEALYRAALQNQFKEIARTIQELVIKHIPALSRALSSIFGTASTVAGTVQNTASTAGGVAGGASSGIGAAAAGASGAVGLVGVVAQVGTLISSIVGNFQFAAMNKSLDIIVNHTLRTANQLIDGLQPQINAYLPFLASIHERLLTLVNTGVGVFNAPGTSGLNVRGGSSSGGAVYNFYMAGATFGAGTTPAQVQAYFTEAARLKALTGN